MISVSVVYFCRKCAKALTTREDPVDPFCEKCAPLSEERHTKALVVGDTWEGHGGVVRIVNADRRYVSYCSGFETLGHATKESFRRRFRPVSTSDTPPPGSR